MDLSRAHELRERLGPGEREVFICATTRRTIAYTWPTKSRPRARTAPAPTSTRPRRASGSRRSTRSSRTTGPTRARQLLTRVVERAQHAGTGPIATLNTPYVNTIPPEREAKLPGDPAVERRLRSIVRWNAMAMVVRANKESSELGGHIASYQSLATLYEVGYNHFWRAAERRARRRPRLLPGPLVAGQLRARVSRGPADRGAARRLPPGGLEARRADLLSAPVADAGLLAVPDRVARDRRDHLDLPGAVHEVPPGARESPRPRDARCGRSSATARSTSPRRWARSGSPVASSLDNLIWVVNANLQRLDGPVRGNGKIIQELESDFRGAGWNVIKVIWGSRWDPLLAADVRRSARAGDGGVGRRRVPDLQVARRRVRARALLRQGPGAARARRAHVGRRDLAVEPRRARPAEGLRRLPRGGPPHRAADGDPREDDQGLRDGRLGRGPDDHPPGQEDDRGRAAGVPRPFRAAADRRAGPRRRVLQAARRLPGDAVPARAPRTRSAGRCRCAGERAEPLPVPLARAVQLSARGHRRPRRSRRRWRSCACSRRCCATSSSAAGSSRSCPTSRARSGWRDCSARSGSTPRSVSATSRRTPSS